ncbi:hypothetical protein RI129_005429 [Pyrocoelia pectoralis]|uniref:Uncharacterized protein n=1 Tax=Pyrocoelia pectoralis TaxID=417401 RepID=A0AAN7VES8_9COLE
MDLGLSGDRKENPRERANIFSVITFLYTLPTFFEGIKRDLEISDLSKTYSKHRSKLLGDKIELAWREEETRAAKMKSKPSLKRVLIKLYGIQFMWHGLLCCIVEFVARLLQPLFLGKLISYYSHDGPPMTRAEAYGYAGGIVGCSLLAVLIIHPYVLSVLHIGMQMRVACCSLIYRKALRLSKTALGQTTIGQMVNLLSNDVNRFDVAVLFAHYFWIGPIQSIIVTYFMYEEVGLSALLGVIVLFLFIPLQLGLAKMIAKFRFKTATRTDERVRLMNEVIAGIQVIKMYTWEKPFVQFISLARRYEIQSIRGASYVRAVILSFMLFATRISLFITILCYILFGQQITAKKVFVVTAFYSVLRQGMTNFFPQAVSQISEAIVSINRLNHFLLYEEKAPNAIEMNNDAPKANGNNYKEHSFILDDNDGGDAIVIKGGSARWSEASVHDYIFKNLNINIKQGSVVAIIGPVGSGKSSLLQVILKELPLLEGKLKVYGDIGYASQEPWLFTGTIRQNITFNKIYENQRYWNVVTKCSLKRDFSLFPNSDKTIVGERGVSLSGGQRARINLARAVYQDADIYLLDDPLSAVDAHVGKELFDRCIMGYLKGKTVILVTHQLQFLKDVHHIIIVEDGSVKAQGTFDELQKSGLDFAKMLRNELEAVEEKESKLSKISRENSVVSMASLDNMSIGEVVKFNEEQTTKGTVSGYVYKMYLVAGNSWFVVCCIALMFLLAQLTASVGDLFITYWVNAEGKRFNLNESSVYTNDTNETIFAPQNITTDSWNISTETSIYIYTVLTSIVVVLAITRSISFFYACMRSSVKLHDNMFNSIISGSMRFFNTNSSGRILNRFSKDMGAIDELLPTAMIDCVQIFLVLFGIIAVVGSVNPWLLIPTFVIAVIFYFLRRFYLSTSRSVKRLEGVTRSPVFAHLNASLQGVATIRAFGAQQTLIQEFDDLQDLHSVTWYLFISTSRAFGYWLDLICVVYIGLVTLSFLFLGDGVLSGNVGLAITQSLGLTGMFQWGMRQSAEMENQMTSVERVLEYNKIEHERALESAPSKKPPISWPARGEIQFVKVFLSYFPQDPPVLVNLNFTINPLEKVGIVGRTGAGKSSLINTLFQLTDVSGSILIDGVDITGIGLHDLRSKLSIIPQEPVLFSGTLRKNLDPFNEYSDVDLWKALGDVELKEAAEELTLGLNSAVLEGGTNFSVGQRQLICLARAILRNNRILILDEATANVDPQTDALIQSTIREKFAQCTVLTIAHRLNTIMDSDKVLVMDAGTMIEFDHPFKLLQNENGALYDMVQQTGKAMADSLKRVAADSYKAKKQQESSKLE